MQWFDLPQLPVELTPPPHRRGGNAGKPFGTPARSWRSKPAAHYDEDAGSCPAMHGQSGQSTNLRPRRNQHYIAHSHSVLVCGHDGFVEPGTEQGLRVFQTRSIACLRYFIGDRMVEPVSLSPVQHHSWLGYYISRLPGDNAAATQQTIELRVSRFAGHGLHEELDLTNYSQQTATFEFALEIGADFADQDEAGSREREARGNTTIEWRDGETPQLVFEFDAEHAYEHQGERGTARVHQAIAVRVQHADSRPSYSEGRISFPIELQPKAAWHACVDFIPTLGEQTLEPLYSCGAFTNPPAEVRKQEDFVRFQATQFAVPPAGGLAPQAAFTIRQAVEDLAALRLHDLDRQDGWVAAAGWPEFVALFGRDSLTVAWQASLLSADLLRGTLPALAGLQGKTDNPWRDEQPGKMPHQASNRLTAMLNYNPFQRYYGSITTSAVFPFALATLWQQTGDTELARRYIDPALAAIHWRDTLGDLDGDGFGEYLCRSEKGLKNQAWKDSGDAIVDENGAQVQPPVATCEEQGFLYIAKLRMAELLWWLDRKHEAKQLFHQASELKKRFNEAFWMEDLGFFALGLDANKRRIRSITSNPGHLLATAIVDQELARRTAERLMMEDLFSGWGVRTLSTANPAYDPFAYQRGSVWPAENGLFALGFLRYGLHEHVERLCRAQFEAAALFEHNRLPEVFAGHPRDAQHPFPAVYPKANWPQAWSSGAVCLYIAALLGIFPYAPLKLLFVDPHLPEWLPQIRMSNFHVGQAIVDMEFYRKEDGESDYAVKDLQGTLHVVRQPSPWSLTAGAGERFVDLLTSFLPRHSAP